MAVRLAALLFCLLPAQLHAEEPAKEPPAEESAELTPAEQAFAKAMSNATLRGAFTTGADAAPRAERYDLGKVSKVGDGLWQIRARIRYGEHDVELPLTLPVDFAGDAAVIRVDNVGFPGLGVYSARVMIQGGKYAGYWQGGGHGGHLFGELVHGAEKTEAE
ncbi:hypothetical protein Pla123a_00510 [Posidoniimonas polymericola]|uniref:Uncharacterized protein n=1 Tax=Posidoniimonas polymericola TaxID=2528002 RepID=A0A5C5ZD38_9BACT|nr:hypothetical protein [Posidoniimonas polymericola]TWT85244.1 hypothetical protein Pla123a_00510 [Posidoniimonas polymericola]